MSHNFDCEAVLEMKHLLELCLWVLDDPVVVLLPPEDVLAELVQLLAHSPWSPTQNAKWKDSA